MEFTAMGCTRHRRLRLLALAPFLLSVSCSLCTAAFAQKPGSRDTSSPQAAKSAQAGTPALDRSGKPRRGKASFYANSFAGRTMADGTKMNPNANIAASRTLPLGTMAKVTNLGNGKSEVVEIRDRGPYVDGRIVDVSPKVAEKLRMKEQGVAAVVVEPLAVPQPDGSIKPGPGLASNSMPDNNGGAE